MDNFNNDTVWVNIEKLECYRGDYGIWWENGSRKLGVYEIPESYQTISEYDTIEALKQYGLLEQDADAEIEFTGFFAEVTDAHSKEPLYRLWAVEPDRIDWLIEKGFPVYSIQ